MFSTWKMLSLASREIRGIGIRCWPLDSAMYLVYSTHEIIDDEGKILFDVGWQQCYNAIWDGVERRKINRNTAKINLYGLALVSVRNDKLLVENKKPKKKRKKRRR